MTVMPTIYYKASEAAELLGISKRAVHFLVKRGRLPGAVKDGEHLNSGLRIPDSAIGHYRATTRRRKGRVEE